MSQDSGSPSVPLVFNSKRSACDRCHGQKLRCPPRPNNQEPCARCARLGARCATSHQLSVSARNHKLSAQRLSKQPKPPPLRSKEVLVASPQWDLHPGGFATSVCDNVVENMADLLSTDGGTSPHNASGFPVPEDYLDLFNYNIDGLEINVHPGVLMETDFPNRDNNASPLSVPTLSTGTESSRFNSIAREQDSTTTSSPPGTLQREQEVKSPNSSIKTELPPLTEWNQHLSSICLGLSRRLHQWQSITAFRADKDEPSSNRRQPDLPWDPRLFGNTLSDTAKFIVVIQSYKSSSISSNPGAHIGIVVILNIVSTYLQTVGMYSKLLQSLCNQLLEPATSLSRPSPMCSSTLDDGQTQTTDLQVLPGLQVAGFSIQQGSLQTKILMDSMLHQLSTIERLLGLPAGLRVTDQLDSDNDYGEYHAHVLGGLFEKDERAKVVLEAVQHSGGSSHMTDVDVDYCGVGTISTLRETIKKVHEFLKK